MWIGFYTRKPLTEDFAPLFPWFGFVLIGMFVGNYILRKKQLLNFTSKYPAASQLKWLVIAGRNSLLIYMVHQPLLMGLLYLVTAIR